VEKLNRRHVAPLTARNLLRFTCGCRSKNKKKPADVFQGYSDSVGNNPTSLGQAQ
jgi:hypothetical protein